MKVVRIPYWIWGPKLFQSDDPKAPFRSVVHVGYWLIFFGGNDG